jgi:alanine racemase
LNPPRLTLDLGAVRHNVACWRALLDGRELWAVVKSDAYGLGAVAIARACVEAGASRLVVFQIEEAWPLRAARIEVPIVHVFATTAKDLPTALQLRVTPSIEDLAGALALSDIAKWRARRAAAHIAVDTGTGWSGVPASRAGELARSLHTIEGVLWEGAWTHVAGPESQDAQLRSFATAVASMREQGLRIPDLHVASTGAMLWGKTTGAARIGVGLYGSTLGAAAPALALKTAIEVRASVVALKRFDAATPLGYGGHDTAAAGETIATLRIGYADGLPKSLADGGGIAIVGGVRCPIAGAIGMNCTFLRVPDGAPVRVGDDALLVGEFDGIRLDEVARCARLIPHAIITGLCNGIRAGRGASA